MLVKLSIVFWHAEIDRFCDKNSLALHCDRPHVTTRWVFPSQAPAFHQACVPRKEFLNHMSINILVCCMAFVRCRMNLETMPFSIGMRVGAREPESCRLTTGTTSGRVRMYDVVQTALRTRSACRWPSELSSRHVLATIPHGRASMSTVGTDTDCLNWKFQYRIRCTTDRIPCSLDFLQDSVVSQV